jgi:hypothetical protein
MNRLNSSGHVATTPLNYTNVHNSGGVNMALIKCDISEGPRAGFKTVGVPSFDNHKEYLSIEEKFLVKKDHGLLLAVDVIGKDHNQKLTLIELPFEADSGANRVWVRDDVFYDKTDEVLA